VWRHQIDRKRSRLARYGERVWSLSGTEADVALRAIERTEAFFESMGLPTRLSGYGIDATEAASRIRARLEERGSKMGEDGSIGPRDVEAILLSRA
jgi:NADP-dependent alcohol dehydrogenase